jgi:hypothetical protein
MYSLRQRYLSFEERIDFSDEHTVLFSNSHTSLCPIIEITPTAGWHLNGLQWGVSAWGMDALAGKGCARCGRVAARWQ